MYILFLVFVFLIGLFSWFVKEWHNAIEIDDNEEIIDNP